MPAVDTSSGLAIARAAAKNILKSGDLSMKGVMRSVSKAVGKQKKKDMFGGEIGNEFREEFGLKTKMTYAEKEELEELEEKRREQEIQQMKDEAIQEKINQQKAKIAAQKSSSVDEPRNENGTKMSVKDQMELLQQVKALLDAGILTQEEFEQKKKEILNG